MAILILCLVIYFVLGFHVFVKFVMGMGTSPQWWQWAMAWPFLLIREIFKG